LKCRDSLVVFVVQIDHTLGHEVLFDVDVLALEDKQVVLGGVFGELGGLGDDGAA
jgi:hypothetical protein